MMSDKEQAQVDKDEIAYQDACEATSDIQMGDPVIMWQASGMHKYSLFWGSRGTAIGVQVIDDIEYICFHPEGMEKFFWCTADRFMLDIAKMKVKAKEE